MAARVVTGERRASARPRPDGRSIVRSGVDGRRLLTSILLVAIVGLSLVVPILDGRPVAGAAPPTLSITLSADSDADNSRIGDPITLIARVTAGVEGENTVLAGWYVQFSGEGIVPWTSGLIETDGEGNARYQHAGQLVGTEQITASIVTEGCSDTDESNRVTWNWWQPQIDLTPVDSVSAIGGGAYTVNARLHHDGVPLSGQRLEFTVQEVDFSTETFSRFETTDQFGNASINWTKPDVTVEAIRVQEADANQPAVAGGSHVWDVGAPTNLRIALNQSSTESLTGTDLQIDAQVFIGGTPAAGRELLLFSTETNGLVSQTTDSQGRATFHKVADISGPDSLLTYIRGVRGSYSLLHRWWTNPVLGLPTQTRAFTGQDHRLTATTSFAGLPASGISLDLDVINAAGADDVHRTATSSGAGAATFGVWTRTASGSDELTLSLTDVSEGPTIGDSLGWSPPARAPIDVTLTAGTPMVRVGSATQLTASVFEPVSEGDDLPVTGWDVTLRENPDGPPLDVAESAAAGAILRTTRNVEGAVSFVATVTIPGCNAIASEPATVTWALPQLTLEPPTATGPARTDLTMRGRLMLGGEPLVGAGLEYVSHSQTCRLPDLRGSVTTDEAGFAEFQLRRDGPSTDRVTLREVGVVQPQSAEARAIWGTPDPSPITVSLRQSSPDGRVGTPVTVTATVTNFDGEKTTPVQGASVIFSGTDTGRTFTTGPDGTVSYTYSRPVPRTDRIAASTPFGCDRAVSNSVDHEWWLPTLTLTPSTATSTVGDEATAVATLTHDGVRLTGIPLQFTVTSSTGQPTLPDGAQPDTVDGRSEFTWTRSAPGLDTVTVRETGVASPVPATATRRWESPRPRPELTATPDGTSGPVGEVFTMDAGVEVDDVAAPGVEVHVTAVLPGQPDVVLTGTTQDSGHAELSWVRQLPGEETITVTAVVSGRTLTRTLTRTWTSAPPVTPEPDTPSPQTPTPETRDPESPSPGPPTPQPPTPEPSDPPETEIPPSSTQVEGPEVGRPGGDIQVAGTGCKPGEQVTISLGDVELGTTQAAADGTFYLRTVVPDLPLGRYVIRSSCGTTIGDPNVDITEPQVNKSLAGIAAAGVTTASTFVFFLLLAKGVISFLPRRWS